MELDVVVAWFAIVLGSHVLPAMSFLHVLLAVGLAFRAIWAWLEVTLIQGWSRRMLVIVMTIHLLLRGPAILMVLARVDGAFPRAGVSLLMLRQITRPFELLVTSGLAAALGNEIRVADRLLPPSHGPQHVVVVVNHFAQCSFKGRRDSLVHFDRFARGDGNGGAVLLDTNNLGGLPVLAQATPQAHFVRSIMISRVCL